MGGRAGRNSQQIENAHDSPGVAEEAPTATPGGNRQSGCAAALVPSIDMLLILAVLGSFEAWMYLTTSREATPPLRAPASVQPVAAKPLPPVRRRRRKVGTPAIQAAVKQDSTGASPAAPASVALANFRPFAPGAQCKGQPHFSTGGLQPLYHAPSCHDSKGGGSVRWAQHPTGSRRMP